MVVQGSLASFHLKRQRSIRLYPRNAGAVSIHAPIEQLAIICGDSRGRYLYASPIQVVVFGVARLLLPSGVIVVFRLLNNAHDPREDNSLLLAPDESTATYLEICDGNCADHPSLNVIGLIGGHFSREDAVHGCGFRVSNGAFSCSAAACCAIGISGIHNLLP